MKRISIALFTAAIIALILACADGGPVNPPVATPDINQVYATANVRIDDLQATAQAIMTEAAK